MRHLLDLLQFACACLFSLLAFLGVLFVLVPLAGLAHADDWAERKRQEAWRRYRRAKASRPERTAS